MRIAVLVSGRGSNLQSIIDNINNGKCNAVIGVVLSNKANAYALQRAQQAGIANFAVLPENFEDKAAYEKRLIEYIHQYNCDLVVLAGYMRLVGDTLLNEFPDRIINIHPALLPSFPGLHAQRQAVEYGVRVSGCTVHFVDSGMDTGKIIAQKTVPVFADDTEDSLSARILEQEHILLPQVINDIANDKIKIVDNKVIY